MDKSLLANCIFVLVYGLFILEKLPKVVVALLAASIIMLSGVLTQRQAFGYIDFNVIFLLVGMMIVVNILKQTGLFEWLAFYTAKAVNGSGIKLLVLFCLITGVCSAFLDNVTTILFMASITCSLAEKLRINPIPLLISEVIASNIGGTATLIGDPPNILIASGAGLTFNDFLVHIAPAIVVILPVAIGTLCLIYGRQLRLDTEAQQYLNTLSLNGLIKDKALLIKGLVVLALIFLGFVTHHITHQEVGTIALAGAAVLMLFEDPKSIWDDVEWDTIFFFIGLFIVVGALEHVGTLTWLGQQFAQFAHGDLALASLALLGISGIASAIVDNIPYTATMIPIIQTLGKQIPDVMPLWWALSLGACLGGNGTLIGATANVVAADIAAYKCGQRIRFVEFMKVGGLIAIQSILISGVYLWFRYLR